MMYAIAMFVFARRYFQKKQKNAIDTKHLIYCETNDSSMYS